MQKQRRIKKGTEKKRGKKKKKTKFIWKREGGEKKRRIVCECVLDAIHASVLFYSDARILTTFLAHSCSCLATTRGTSPTQHMTTTVKRNRSRILCTRMTRQSTALAGETRSTCTKMKKLGLHESLDVSSYVKFLHEIEFPCIITGRKIVFSFFTHRLLFLPIEKKNNPDLDVHAPGGASAGLYDDLSFPTQSETSVRKADDE